MPRHRRMLAPIVTEKHYQQNSVFTVAAGAVGTQDVVRAVKVLNKNLDFEVEEGNIVKAVYLEYWVSTNDTTPGSVIFTVEKLPAAAALPNSTTMADLGSYTNKKNILFTFMGLTNSISNTVIPVIKNWLLIPKGKQRFGLDDRLVLSWMSQTGTLKVCGFATFKEHK